MNCKFIPEKSYSHY